MSILTQPVIRPMPRERAREVGDLIARVVKALPYYNERARREEVSKYGPAELAEIVTTEPLAVLTADVDGRLAGFCISRYDDGLLWLAWFGVDEPFRRCGVGAALVGALENTLAERRAHKIWCDTRTDNVASQRLLTRFGFTRIAKLTNHWYGQDFYLWEKYPS
jgi:ribosomal protein S18 acetylase RimI-like enzyme